MLFEAISGLKIKFEKIELILIGGVANLEGFTFVLSSRVENLLTMYASLWKLFTKHQGCGMWKRYIYIYIYIYIFDK